MKKFLRDLAKDILVSMMETALEKSPLFRESLREAQENIKNNNPFVDLAPASQAVDFRQTHQALLGTKKDMLN